MEWLGHLFEKYPEMAVYLAIGLSHLIGGLSFAAQSHSVIFCSPPAERSSLRC
jgi:hypothetical protein